METRVIIVSEKKSNKSDNTVWAVAIAGEEKPKAFCKSAYKAMRFAFLLKVQTGLNISDNCLCRLSFECAKRRAAIAADVQGKMEMVAESHRVENVLAQPEEKPAKKQRKPRAKKNSVKAR